MEYKENKQMKRKENWKIRLPPRQFLYLWIVKEQQMVAKKEYVE